MSSDVEQLLLLQPLLPLLPRPPERPGNVSEPSAGQPRQAGGAEQAAALLDPESRNRLRSFNALTAPWAPVYFLVLRLFASASDNFTIHLSRQQVEASLAGQGIDHAAFDLDAALDSLVGWNLLVSEQDTSRVTSLREFAKRRSLYQLTSLGRVVVDGAERAIAVHEEQGSLQKVALISIRDDLHELAALLTEAEPDAEAVLRKLMDLNGSFTSLTENARDFHNSIRQARRTETVDDEQQLLLYKQLLFHYLQAFLNELTRRKQEIAEAITAVEATGRERMLRLAAEKDKPPRLTRADDGYERWSARWAGIHNWFIGSGGASGVEQLLRATKEAINDLIRLVQRLGEASERRVTRARDLLRLAELFSACASDQDAHDLFAVSFGIWSPRHIRHVTPAPGRERDLVLADDQLVEARPGADRGAMRGIAQRRPNTNTTRALCNDAKKAQLRATQRARMSAEREAQARLQADPGKLGRDRLDEEELAVLKRLIDRAKAQSRQRARWRAETADGRLRLVIDPGGETAISTTRGILTIEGLARLEAC